MKKILIFFFTLFLGIVSYFYILFNDIEYFPLKETVLVDEFHFYQNFFPIAIIDLKDFGIDKKIPLVYVFFDHPEKGFKDGDNCDHFSFTINKNNKLKPSFKSVSLEMTDGYKIYLDKSIPKFDTFKKEGRKLFLIDFSQTPTWMQNNETPKKINGIDMKFICQIDVDDLVEDDCKMYVFYDENSSEIRIIYQRT